MLKQNITDEQIAQKLEQLLYQYPNAYTRLETIHIYKNCLLAREKNYIDYILQEVLDQIGVLEEKNNIYKLYTDLLEDNYGLEQPILEVGGGRFARVANRIAQKQTTGSITMYDPKIISTQPKSKNLTLLKTNFDHNTQLNGAKLLTGLLPCDATYAMVELACKNKINFQIALCNCLISEFFVGERNEEEAFNNYVIKQIQEEVKDAGMGHLEVTYFKEYGFNNPIIYTKFKK